MLKLIILFLIAISIVILDVSVWDIIETPRSKSIFIICTIISIILLIISLSPGIFVEQPGGIYGGDFKAHILKTEFKQEKTIYSVLAFSTLIIMIALSPYWYRINNKISKGETAKFSLAIVIIGTLFMISFFPEIIVGQRPWVDPKVDNETMTSTYSNWISKRRNLNQIWIVITVILVLNRDKVNQRLRNIFDIE